MKLTSITLIGLVAISANCVSANENTQLVTESNGYTRVVVDTEREQKEPLQTVLTFEMPTGVRNVGQAINYTLEKSGYKLIPLDEANAMTLNLYTLQYPITHKRFKQSNVKQIIEVLAGSAYEVKQNHLARTIEIIPRITEMN